MNSKVEEALRRIEEIFPKLSRSDVNERTVLVWRRRYVDRIAIADIAREFGWSVPAVTWHLRRAARALNPE